MSNIILEDHNYVDSDEDDEEEKGVILPQDGYNNLYSHTKHVSRMDLRLRQSLCEIETEERYINIFTGTWNLHAKPPPDNLNDFIVPNKYDLYVIGTEECEATIQKSFIKSSKVKWTQTLKKLLGDNYIEVAQETLMAIHIISFIHKDLYHLVNEIETGRVATGLANRIGNKGGVALCFDIGATSFLFMNCHLAAHQDHVEARNANFHSINNRMPLRLKENEHIPSKPCSEKFDCVIWMGDLNYRIQGTRCVIDSLIKNGMIEVMRANDQLSIEMKKGSVFKDFQEGELKFSPTYKFNVGSSVYDSSPKQRIPSWTDRILYKSTPLQTLDLLMYDCVPSIHTSDHLPVYAHFSVLTRPPSLTAKISNVINGPIHTNDESDDPISQICELQ